MKLLHHLATPTGVLEVVSEGMESDLLILDPDTRQISAVPSRQVLRWLPRLAVIEIGEKVALASCADHLSVLDEAVLKDDWMKGNGANGLVIFDGLVRRPLVI
jgi:acyl-CoA reductase-like NAD-dependent aldehyde dehydrogenase